jgi:hypothetical protein
MVCQGMYCIAGVVEGRFARGFEDFGLGCGLDFDFVFIFAMRF